MKDRFEVEFEFKGNPYIANVYVMKNNEGYNYIINLFDKKLNLEYPRSYTFIGKDNQFIPAKPISDNELDLVNQIKQAIREHPENQYRFID